MRKEIRKLKDRFLSEVYNGTAHPWRHQVLDEFTEWVEREEKQQEALDLAGGKIGPFSLNLNDYIVRK